MPFHRNNRCRYFKSLVLLVPPALLVGCGSVPLNEQLAGQPVPPVASAKKSQTLPALPPAGSGRGGYYKDDGPGENPPEGLLDTPDAEPKVEPYSTRANRPYVVFGKSYTPITDERPYKQRGIGSWYGRKFHGQKTSSGEIYDMYKMTAAHPTLPIPSYVRVTNVANGKQVIVRVNDRGPFHSGRIIDLSYTAALKLGYLGKGSSELEVERLLPEQIARIQADKKAQMASAQPAPEVEILQVAAGDALPRTELRPLPELEQTAYNAPSAFASTSASQTPNVVPMPAAAGAGYYVQLGAYSQAVNANAARERLQQNLPGGVAPLEVIESGALHRVYSGPYASRADAAAAAIQLQAGSAAKPVIVQR